MTENSSSGSNPMDVGLEPSKFDWILDKDLLRDEGVYFGLSDYDHIPEEKLEAIRQHYMERIKVFEKSIASAELGLKSKDISIADGNQTIAKYRENEDALKKAFSPQTHEFWRKLASVLVYLSMMLFNFWLVFNWLLSSSPSNALVTALGIYLFGSLSLFSPLSMLYHRDSVVLETETGREKWKVYLEEFVVPLIATLYLALKGSSSHNLLEIIFFSLFVYALFLFAGKGLISHWTGLRKEISSFKKNLSDKKFQRTQLAQIRQEIEDQERDIARTREKMLEIRRQILEQEQSVAMLYEQKETNVALFLSEFELAKASRHNLNRRQIAQIVSNRR